MAFCANCGHQLAEGAKFCYECGAKVNESCASIKEERKTVYDGKIHKCPNCGEIIEAFMPKCMSCGYELRGTNITSKVHEFAISISASKDISKKAELIRNFYIPNTKEDITEFFILAISNIESDAECREAWVAKLEQAYQKARFTLGDSDEFTYLSELYHKCQKELQKKRKISSFIKPIEQSKRIQAVILGTIGVGLMIVGIVLNGYYMLTMVGIILLGLSAQGWNKKPEES